MYLSESEKLIGEQKNAQLVFVAYKPTNAIQMREYALYLIEKNLMSMLKKEEWLKPLIS